MEIRHVNTFVEIMNAGSFAAAARKMGYAQSTMTGHVRHLEKDLAVELFSRTGKVNTPTREAMAFLPHARNILAAEKEAMDMMTTFSGQMMGEVVLGTTQAVWVPELVDAIVSFSEECPKVGLTLKQIDFREVVHEIKGNIIDLAFVTCQPVTDPFLRTCAFRRERMVLAFSPGRYSGGKPNKEQLFEERFIVNWRGCIFRTLLERHFHYWGMTPIVTEVDSVPTMKEFCVRGLGLIFVPFYAIAREIKSGVLDYITFERQDEKEMRTQLLIHRDKVTTPALTALCAKLATFLAR